MANEGELVMARTAYEVQKDFALLSGWRAGAVWDALSAAEGEILRRNIANLMPDVEGRRQNQVETARSELFNAVWCQRKYTHGALHSALIYVLVTQEENFESAKRSTQYTCHPVYRTRKCTKRDTGGRETTTGCCMIFVDEHGRVYKNWQNYLDTNTLPKGLMLAPVNGVYNIDDDEEIVLHHQLTPAATTSGIVVDTTDTVVGSVGMAAALPLLASLAMPVSAPLLAVASAVGIGAATYGSLRSATHLVDRAQHEQTNSLANRDARNSWLNLGGGAITLGAAGATNLFVRSYAAGQSVTTANRLIVSGLNISAVFISGSGAISGVYDIILKIRDDEPVTGMDIFQLASSLMIFTHSVNNLRLANKIIDNSQKGRTARRTLRRNLRQAMGISPSAQPGNMETSDFVRIFNDIPGQDALMVLHQTYTNLVAPTAEARVANVFNADFDIVELAHEYGQQFVDGIRNLENFRNVWHTMGMYLTVPTVHFLARLAKTFIQISSEFLAETLQTVIPSETVLYRLFINVIQKYTNFAVGFLESKTTEILNAVQAHFDALAPLGGGGQRSRCSDCDGYYSLYNIT